MLKIQERSFFVFIRIVLLKCSTEVLVDKCREYVSHYRVIDDEYVVKISRGIVLQVDNVFAFRFV